MLTRAGSAGIRVLFGVLPFASIVVADIAVYRAPSWQVRSCDSPVQTAGMPLVGRAAHGVVAYSAVATGMVAIGGVTAGVIAPGAISAGAFSFGALSLGISVLAAPAASWRPRGALAFGPAPPGARSIGRYGYGFGIALGYHEASVKQKESLFG